ncbi:MAG TPA: hypothetical protein VLF89_00830 [Candidatus Saccharimonadales bacterium]|nr:hypothetical protein [Candidatus Saccharimonadales bacterium]
MQQKIINIPLEDIQVKQIYMKHHRTELRRTLLNSPYWERKQRQRFLFWKGGEEIMRRNKFVTASIVFGVTVVILSASFVILPRNTKKAYAEEIAQKSYQAITSLSPKDQEALKLKVHMDPSELLQEAKNAKDLKSLTYDQFISQYPQVKLGFGTQDPNDSDIEKSDIPETSSNVDLHNFKFLAFTDTQGRNVILGIDENNLPVFAFSQGKDGDTGFSVQGKTNGSNKAMFGSVRIDNDKHITGAPEKKMSVSFKEENSGNTLMINGKKYSVPVDIKLSNEPPTVKMEGDSVYINGVKATLEK